MARLIFQPCGKRVEVNIGKNVFEAAREAGVNIKSICGGRGVCGKCGVMIRDGKENLSPPSGAETLFVSENDLKNGFRLACQTLISNEGTVIVEIPPESQVDQQRLLLNGLERKVILAPAVKKITVHLKNPSLLDVKSDFDRLANAVKTKSGLKPKIDYEALKKIPHILRKGYWTVTVMLWRDQEITSVESGVTCDFYGFAVDAGTTKLAGYLVDLSTGKIVATASRMNPQIVYGEDVISRVSYIMEDEKNLRKLQQSVVNGVNWLINEACKEAGVSPEKIYDVTVAGNTAMHHILLGIPPNYVAQTPYPAALQSPIDIKSRDLGVKTNCGVYVHALPVIAGFVGGDTVADILATGIHQMNDLAMLIDVGTNTEIVLGNKNRLIACSCASGSAFEGAHIKHGMRATTGAIEHVSIDPETLDVTYTTIEEERPRGICGSAIVDVIAEMLKSRIINRTGRFNVKLETPRLRTNTKEAEFVLAWKDETSTKKDIGVTQSDIREIQLAKAAIYTGASILMKHAKVFPNDIQKIFLAGAFGNYVDPQSAKIIGMYPDVPLERVQFVGNTAGSGARMALLSVNARKTAENIAEHVDYLELGADINFQNEFLKATYLPHQETERFPNATKILEK